MHIPSAWKDRYSAEKLDAWRNICDPLADNAAAHLKRARPSAMLEQLEDLALAGNADCRAFLDVTRAVPAWVDWQQVEHGRRVTLAFSAVRAIGLLAALMEGYSLSRAAHVLVATGRLNQDVSRRLQETGQMSHNMNAPGGLLPGGIGHRHVLEVRLLHAMVRRFLRDRHWDVSQYQQPINQEDMAFTVIEFDHLAARGMARLGATLSPPDRNAVHHLWRYAAWLHGVDEQLITQTPAEEEFLYNAILTHQQRINDDSRALADSVLAGLANQPPLNLSERALRALSRAMLDENLANAYGLKKDPLADAGVALLKQANRLLTAAHYRLPGAARAAEVIHFELARRALNENLGEADKRAFRGMA
jgi:hypothetical protein